MRLTVIGCSPAWPNPGGAHSGYLVEAEGCGRLLLDCGPGVLSRLRAWDLLPVDAIAITHFHLDHCGDLVPWCWMAMHSDGDGRRPALLLPPGGRARLAQIEDLLGRLGMVDEVFEVSEYPVRRRVEAVGFALEAFPMRHYDMDAFGFRVGAPDGAALGYTGDTAPCPGLDELASEASLLLCEATLATPEQGEVRGHLSAEQAVATARGELLVTHRPPELPLPGGVARATEGLVVEPVGAAPS